MSSKSKKMTKEKYDKLRTILTSFIGTQFPQVNMNSYDWYGMMSYYCKEYHFITNKKQVIGTLGYSFLKNDLVYLALEIPHKAYNNDALVMFWTDIDDLYIIIEKHGNLIKPLCVGICVFQGGKTQINMIEAPSNFKNRFPLFNNKNNSDQISDYIINQKDMSSITEKEILEDFYINRKYIF